MNSHHFSSEITKLATVPQAMDRYKICRNTLMKFAGEHDAVVRFGKCVRIDCEKLDASLYNADLASIGQK